VNLTDVALQPADSEASILLSNELQSRSTQICGRSVHFSALCIDEPEDSGHSAWSESVRVLRGRRVQYLRSGASDSPMTASVDFALTAQSQKRKIGELRVLLLELEVSRVQALRRGGCEEVQPGRRPCR
jgi:hypothetical protein